MDFYTSEEFLLRTTFFSFRGISNPLAQWGKKNDLYFSIIGIHLNSDFLSYVR